jgi:5-methyltetrahydropteroyltriglutamate--homocysteine methyltransferase
MGSGVVGSKNKGGASGFMRRFGAWKPAAYILQRGQEALGLLFAREFGQPCDSARFDAGMHAVVDDAVRRQVAAGIKDRLSGFDGDSSRQIALDLEPCPDFRERMGVFAGERSFMRQVCVGPIAVKEREPMHKDIAKLQAAAGRHRPTGAFMNAA